MAETRIGYSVAWTPQPGSALARFGAAWFGWCAEQGERRERLPAESVGRPVAPLADAAGSGCLRAPLMETSERPLENGARFALEAAIARAANAMAPVPIGPLGVVRRTRGLALAPRLPSLALVRAMRSVAEALGDRPPTNEFCLPLTGPLGTADAVLVSAALTRLLRPEMLDHQVLSELTLIAYPGTGHHPVVLERHGFGSGETQGALSSIGPDMLIAEKSGALRRRT